MSRLEHYAGQDEIGLRYNSHRTKREEYLVMSGDEFMERFSWHVADKGGSMVRYYGFLSPAKRRLLEDVVYVIVNATMFDRYGDADDFLDCFIIPARIVGGTFWG